MTSSRAASAAKRGQAEQPGWLSSCFRVTTPPVRHGSLDDGVPAELPEELTTVLVAGGGVRIERIVSRGHASAPESWYEQAEDEFVLLVQGAARLEFEEFDLELTPGDWVDLPAGVRHRVAWTAEAQDTVWLAVFRPASGA